MSCECDCVVTGAAGFVGSMLVRRLCRQGYAVLGLDRRPVPAMRRSPVAAYLRLDLRDFDQVCDVIRRIRPQLIFHLAAQALVPQSILDPYGTVLDNVGATASVLEAARVSQVARIVVASSGAVFGAEGGRHVYTESSPMTIGPNLYGPSKVAAEHIAQAYVATFGLDVRIARFMNTYGPGDVNLTRLVPKAIRMALQGTEYDFGCRDDGSTALDFVFIDDVVDGYLAAAAAPPARPGAVYHFGAPAPVSIQTVAETISELAGGPTRKPIFRGPANPHPRSKSLDYARTTATIGWRPQTPLVEGLRATVEWHRADLGATQ